MKAKKSIFVVSLLLSTLLFSTTVFAATSELTGLPVDDMLATQRPIAVMVDNEKAALPHYGTAEADIVYELVNSTDNGRITRLMCLYKDWVNMQQTGSIRSTRTSNVFLANEYNAVLIHDGNPFYADPYLALPTTSHISGEFVRVNNGKKKEFTDYVTGADLLTKFAATNTPVTYTLPQEMPTHFIFNPVDTDLAVGVPALGVNLSGVFVHNATKLLYNATTKTYDYSEYGALHQDAEDKQVMSFKNVLLLDVPIFPLDNNGYMIYDLLGTGSGYYITNGKATAITWVKTSDTGYTHYYNVDGTELAINPGKTYIGLLPSDTWDKVVVSTEPIKATSTQSKKVTTKDSTKTEDSTAETSDSNSKKEVKEKTDKTTKTDDSKAEDTKSDSKSDKKSDSKTEKTDSKSDSKSDAKKTDKTDSKSGKSETTIE